MLAKLPNFDSYIIADWSANAPPKTEADSIWWAAHGWTSGGLEPDRLENPSTRQRAEDSIGRYLREAVAAGKSVLVGFDLPYGYPAGFARLLGLEGPPWPNSASPSGWLGAPSRRGSSAARERWGARS